MATREKLYKDYMNELKMFNPNLIFLDVNDIFKSYKEVSNFNDIEWIDIYDGIECVGFIILANGIHCPPAYDWFIMECYIDSDHRRKGIMTNAVENMIQKHHGLFGMFILSRNEVAARFWDKFVQNRTIGDVKIEPKQVVFNSVPCNVDCYEKLFMVSSKELKESTIPSFE